MESACLGIARRDGLKFLSDRIGQVFPAAKVQTLSVRHGGGQRFWLVTNPATGIDTWADYTEYGQPTTPTTTGATAGGAAGAGYGWLGAPRTRHPRCPWHHVDGRPVVQPGHRPVHLPGSGVPGRRHRLRLPNRPHQQPRPRRKQLVVTREALRGSGGEVCLPSPTCHCPRGGDDIYPRRTLCAGWASRIYGIQGVPSIPGNSFDARHHRSSKVPTVKGWPK